MRAHGQGTTKGQHMYTRATGRDRAELGQARRLTPSAQTRHEQQAGPARTYRPVGHAVLAPGQICAAHRAA